MFVSVLGDSISTYCGYNPKGYDVFYDEYMQRRNCLKDVYDTWWAKVNQALGAYLCVNNSYSGSRVSGLEFPAGCCQERTMHLHTSEYKPDLILIYMGFNDFGYGVPIRCAPLSNDSRINLSCFEDAYHQMLTGLRYFYPNTIIVCATLMKTKLKQNNMWQFPDRLGGINIDDYNDAIRRAAANCHISLADIAERDRRYETQDGTHPKLQKAIRQSQMNGYTVCPNYYDWFVVNIYKSLPEKVGFSDCVKIRSYSLLKIKCKCLHSVS